MRRITTLMLLVAGMALPAPVLAAAPMLFSYQGQITDAGGVPIIVPTTARFTVLWGGTSTENPSTGKPVYQEDVVLTPDAGGIFHHLIGAGTPTNQCDEDRNGTATEPCVLAPNDLPSSGAIVFLELRIDPAGINNFLSPRQQLVNAPYAMNAATIDGLGLAGIVTNVAAGPGLAGGGTGSGVTLSVAAAGVSQAMLAAGSVGATQIQANAVNAAIIVDGSVTSADIAADTIAAVDIATGGVGSAEILDGSIGGPDIAVGVVTSSHIALDTITANDIAPGGVGTTEIATASVHGGHIIDGSVGTNDLGIGAVTTAELQDLSVTDAKVAYITNSKLVLANTFSTLLTTTSVTEQTLLVANGLTGRFCALSQVTMRFVTNVSTNHWCRVFYQSPNWWLGARSNNTTEVTCGAVCF